MIAKRWLFSPRWPARGPRPGRDEFCRNSLSSRPCTPATTHPGEGTAGALPGRTDVTFWQDMDRMGLGTADPESRSASGGGLKDRNSIRCQVRRVSSGLQRRYQVRSAPPPPLPPAVNTGDEARAAGGQAGGPSSGRQKCPPPEGLTMHEAPPSCGRSTTWKTRHSCVQFCCQ